MKKTFWTIVGWLAMPGLMHLMRSQELGTRPKSRPEVWVELGLSVIAMLIYGFAAIYFGEPVMRSFKGILSPLSALVWLPNLVVAIMCTVALFATKGVSKT